jgi:hypothetical protein
VRAYDDLTVKQEIRHALFQWLPEPPAFNDRKETFA